MIERDREVVAPAFGRVADFVMSHGRGSQVYDVDGNRYIDFVAGIAVNATGHSHPKVVAAIQEAAGEFIHISSDYYHERWVRLSERLNEIAPFEEDAQVFLGNSGTEAVEAAIKLATLHTGRNRFIGFVGAFHGRTAGSLAFTASKIVQRQGLITLPFVNHVPYPNAYRPVLAMQPEDEDYGDTVVNYMERVLFKSLIPPDDVAAILVEPIQGEGGYVVPPASFFPRLREICDKHGILLIVDEVQAGMGRTGKWWAIEHTGVEPDIICTAKGIASGVPLGAIVARKSVMTWQAGSHGNTYGGNPLACAAALATLDVLEEEGIENAAVQGDLHDGGAAGHGRAPCMHRRCARQRADDRRRVCRGSREPHAGHRTAQPHRAVGLRTWPAAHGLRRQHHAHHPAADHHAGGGRRRVGHLRARHHVGGRRGIGHG